MMTRVLSVAVLLASLASPGLCGDTKTAAARKGKPAKETPMSLRTTDFSPEKGIFSCSVPAEWRRIPDSREDARSNVTGVLVEGPADPDGVRPTISVMYYGPGNPVADDADGFLKRQFRPGRIKLPEDETSPVSETSLSGRKARRFTRDAVELFPPEALDAKKVPMRRETVVVGHEAGFFLLQFSCPRSSAKALRPVFQKVLDSFRVSAPPKRP